MDLTKKEKEETKQLTERDPLVLETASSSPETGFVRKRSHRYRNLCCLCLLVLVAVVIAAAVGVAIGLGVTEGGSASKSSSSGRESLPNSIKAANLMRHLEELMDIANSSYNNSRAVQYQGYNDSARFIFDTLQSVGYEPIMQNFSVPVFEDEGNANFSAFGDPTLNYTWRFLLGCEFVVMRYSGSDSSGSVSAPLQPINGSGCEDGDYAEFQSGSVALINTTSEDCTVYDKVSLAQNSSATAVVVMRTSSQTDLPPPNYRLYKQNPDGFEYIGIPALGATYQLGQELLDLISLAQQSSSSLMVEIETSTTVTMHGTLNVIADTQQGRESTVIVMGSHLDSVSAGPGINDNGSGSGANLEIALQIARQDIKPKNKVRFAFWGAEELGLLGSNHYVMNLSDEEKENISLNLNFDMMGSPNYVRKVYNGSGADSDIRIASIKIQNVFEDYFNSENLPYNLTDFTGRSDYGPFIEVGIPAGGLFTGAEEVKSEDERADYGGLTNAWQDPCYHRYCDTIDNIDWTVYEQMSQAAAYALDTLMNQEDLPGYLADSD